MSEEQKSNAGASLVGVWDCIAETPIGKQQQEITLSSVSGSKLTGELKDIGTDTVMPLLDGEVDGDSLRWSVQMTKPFKIMLKVEVKVQGHQLSGHANAGMLGKSPLSGTKRP